MNAMALTFVLEVDEMAWSANTRIDINDSTFDVRTHSVYSSWLQPGLAHVQVFHRFTTNLTKHIMNNIEETREESG